MKPKTLPAPIAQISTADKTLFALLTDGSLWARPVGGETNWPNSRRNPYSGEYNDAAWCRVEGTTPIPLPITPITPEPDPELRRLRLYAQRLESAVQRYAPPGAIHSSIDHAREVTEVDWIAIHSEAT